MSAVGQVLASWFAGVEVFVATPIRRAVAQKRRISVAHSSTCTTFINSNVASGRAIAACTSPSCLLPGKDLAGARPPAAPVWPPTGHSSPLAPGCHAHKYPGTLVEVSRCPLKLPKPPGCYNVQCSSCRPVGLCIRALSSCSSSSSDLRPGGRCASALGRRDGLARGRLVERLVLVGYPLQHLARYCCCWYPVSPGCLTAGHTPPCRYWHSVRTKYTRPVVHSAPPSSQLSSDPPAR